MINSPGPDGGAQNIRAERVTFDGTDNGLRVKANRDRGNDVDNLVFRDMQMKNVKNALIISEYYPRILPAGGVSTVPVTRLTPHFHDITIENVTAAGGASAGAIMGLPKAPVRNVVLCNVRISAQCDDHWLCRCCGPGRCHPRRRRRIDDEGSGSECLAEVISAKAESEGPRLADAAPFILSAEYYWFTPLARKPPSTTSVWPVTKEAASEAR